MIKHLFLFVTLGLFTSCTGINNDNIKTVICVPVYGQSYALGEEAVRVTNFDSLRINYNHRIVSERLDEDFGYFADTEIKQSIKRLVNYNKRSFELQCYGMAEEFLQLNKDTTFLFCTFPGGQGATSITELMPDSKPYQKFVKEIENAYNEAKQENLHFIVPAYCWMQGENDIVWQTSKDYMSDLRKFHEEFCKYIKRLTGQKNSPICICYQSNCLSLSKLPVADTLFNRPELYVPNSQYKLIKNEKAFMASGPTYPYDCVNEKIHIDGIGQKILGNLAGLTLSRIFNNQNSDGLLFKQYYVEGNDLLLTFDIPSPPLTFDTLQVKNPGNFGFNVVDSNNKDIINNVEIKNDSILIHCNDNPIGCKLRYAVNGKKDKNGNKSGSRGNLRDSQGDLYKCKINNKIYPLNNWLYQFEKTIQ